MLKAEGKRRAASGRFLEQNQKVFRESSVHCVKRRVRNKLLERRKAVFFNWF